MISLRIALVGLLFYVFEFRVRRIGIRCLAASTLSSLGAHSVSFILIHILTRSYALLFAAPISYFNHHILFHAFAKMYMSVFDSLCRFVGLFSLSLSHAKTKFNSNRILIELLQQL